MNVSSAIQKEMAIFFIKHDNVSHKSWVRNAKLSEMLQFICDIFIPFYMLKFLF